MAKFRIIPILAITSQSRLRSRKKEKGNKGDYIKMKERRKMNRDKTNDGKD